MIELTLARHLTLEAPPQAGRAAHLAAASGLVVSEEALYVVADDELVLGVFPAASQTPGHTLRLLDGDLPLAPRERKRRKADFGALLRLPAFGHYPHGALFALGSGSGRDKPRSDGVLLALDARGALAPDARPRRVALDNLHARLRDEFADLNLEGAVVSGGELVLLQRGNKGQAVNATVHYSLTSILQALARDDALPALTPRALRRHALGAIGDVPLGFTDAAALPDGSLLFSAVAENTDDSVADGACLGAAIGVIDFPAGRFAIERLAAPWKVEGVHAWREAGATRFLAVTDADDPARPAQLLAGRFGAD